MNRMSHLMDSSSPDFHHPVDGLLVQLIIQNLTHILVLNYEDDKSRSMLNPIEWVHLV